MQKAYVTGSGLDFKGYVQQFLRTFSRVGSIVLKNVCNAKETISPKSKELLKQFFLKSLGTVDANLEIYYRTPCIMIFQRVSKQRY
jgi:hypothetical protein